MISQVKLTNDTIPLPSLIILDKYMKLKLQTIVITVLFYLSGAQGRTRTGTEVILQRILSPLRLPIPPLGHTEYRWP